MAKRKKATLPALRRKLDDLFSRWVRLSAADSHGFVTCVTCGKRPHWMECDAGHFIPRAAIAVRWDERNVHPQCIRCNRFRVDAYADYTLWMLDTYGRRTVEELQASKGQIAKMTRADYEQRIDEVAGKLADLAAGVVSESKASRYPLEALF